MKMAKKIKIEKQTANWTTKSGQKMRICDMEDSHLINSLNLLRRSAIIHALASGLSKKGIKGGSWGAYIVNYGIFNCLRLDCERRNIYWDKNELDHKASLLLADTKDGVTIASWGVSKDITNRGPKKPKVNNKFGLLFFEGVEPIEEKKDEEDLEF